MGLLSGWLDVNSGLVVVIRKELKNKTAWKVVSKMKKEIFKVRIWILELEKLFPNGFLLKLPLFR